jgi:predicted AlkP superfamily phosphohydrolase/phosphomutase
MKKKRPGLAIPALATLATLGLLLAPFAADDVAAAQDGKRVIVLGLDGLDYELTRTMMAEGRMPNFERLTKGGTFAPLGTSIPPQSPVAWSNFMTGMDAGGHGIFDFLHRDPNTMIPFLSTSRPADGEEPMKFGKYQLPRGGGYDLLRKGRAFWEVLEEHGVETSILRMPANFPVSGTATRELSGMGTPDVLGTYGTFSFFTTDRSPFAGRDIGGGKVYGVRVRNDVVKGSIYGPPNPYLVETEKLKVDFQVHLDPEEPFAKLVVGDEERVLKEGEWSDWVPMAYDMAPNNAFKILDPLGIPQTLPVMCRFFLKQIRPEFMLYASPANIDPMNPAFPISTPPSYAAELAKASGRFYTQGMMEETKGLTEGVLTQEEFLGQAHIAGVEILDQYRYVLDTFDEGFLFYYFGNQDQTGHMMWKSMDPDHPMFRDQDGAFVGVIPAKYEALDEIVGLTLDRMGDDTTLIVMSDHGFASWRRSMNLNSWLHENGYLTLKNPGIQDDPGFFLNVDWSRTKAYGLGLNGLYVNQRGRERWGIVNESDSQALLAEIGDKLLATVDPETQERAVTKVYRCDETFRHREHLDVGPDMIVGYAKGMRVSDDSALGTIPLEVFADNDGEWSGDHCMDHEAVPGVLVTNRPLQRPVPALENLAAAVLAEFGIEGFAGEVKDTNLDTVASH